MFKDILLVGIGSFVGGSLRMVVSKFVQLAVPGLFPWGTGRYEPFCPSSVYDGLLRRVYNILHVHE